MSKQLPQHVAVIMDGNGRWARRRGKLRTFGHRRGVEVAREIVQTSAEFGISNLTLFALSTENRRRPYAEVSALLKLFTESLHKGIDDLVENGVRLKFLGDFSYFDDKLREILSTSEERTANLDKLNLNIALNYGSRWDIANAVLGALKAGKLSAGSKNEAVERAVSEHLQVGSVDLLIRTGGERRLSNFLLWQSAYSELYFTETLWPDFNKEEYAGALASYAGRERRFGLTGEQRSKPQSAA